MTQTPEPASIPAASSAESLPPEVVYRRNIRTFGEARHQDLQSSRHRNGYFHRYLTKIVAHQILPGSRVLDIGCAAGDMLAAVKPSYGVGIDINGKAIEEARRLHPELTFHEMA